MTEKVSRKTLKSTSNLKYGYIVALSVIVLALIVSQFVIQAFLEDQQDDARVINISGRQRMLSQKISKEALLASRSRRGEHKRQLQTTFQLFEESHLNLTKKSNSFNFSEQYILSDILKYLYQELQPLFSQMQQTTKDIINTETTGKRNVALTSLLKAEKQFLPLMNRIVFKHEEEANAKLTMLKNIEIGIVTFSLFILLMEALFIFQPIVKNTERAMQQTLEANNELAGKNSELMATEEELRQNMEELQAIQEQLRTQKNEAELAYIQLKDTQKQLVETEKIASLGQLTSNVAHEINTPLGAIRSSSVNVEQLLEEVLPSLPSFFKGLDEKVFDYFNQFVLKSAQKKDSCSSKERRRTKYKLIDDLSARSIEQADEYATIIVDANMQDEQSLYLSIIALPNASSVLQMASKVSSVFRSNQTIQLATDRAAKIIYALKSFSNQAYSLEKVPTGINNTIDKALASYDDKLSRGVRVVREFDEVPSFLGYSDELIQVWSSLILNAIQAMNGKGELHISTKAQEESVLVKIKDQGAGIPNEIQGNIFEAFFSTKPSGEGSGLGLYIAQKVVGKHEGKIWFEANENKGITFFVEIPL